MIRIVRFGNVSACAAAAKPTIVSKTISHRFTRSKPITEYSPLTFGQSRRSSMPLFDLDIGIGHDLFPARNFLAQKNRELVRRAAERIDADRRDLPGEFRIFERASDLEIEFLHDVVGRAFGDDDADPCGDAEAWQAGLVHCRNVGSDLGAAKTGLG